MQDNVLILLQVHLVHYNTKYASLTEAVDKPDGLAVLGSIISVSFSFMLAFFALYYQIEYKCHFLYIWVITLFHWYHVTH